MSNSEQLKCNFWIILFFKNHFQETAVTVVCEFLETCAHCFSAVKTLVSMKQCEIGTGLARN